MDARYGILQEGRFKAVQISLTEFVKMLKGKGEKPGYVITQDWLPDDARPIHIYIDYINMRRTIFIVVESETYEVIAPGRAIPLLLPKIQNIINLPERLHPEPEEDLTETPLPLS